MKKSIVLSALLFVLAPIFANEHGFKFDVGASCSIMLKPYVYEQVGYSYKWDSGFFVGGDIRVSENIIPSSKAEPIFYFMGGPTLGYKNFYLSGGVFFFNNMTSIKDTFFYIRTGANFSPWQWGKGKGGMDIALEFSPTRYIPSTENSLENGLVTLFGTIFNFVKLNVGVTYFLPL